MCVMTTKPNPRLVLLLSDLTKLPPSTFTTSRLNVNLLISLAENHCLENRNEFALLLRGAGVSFADLYYTYGLQTCAQLRRLGYDSLDVIADNANIDQLLRMFDAKSILETFLETPGDAVCLTGTSAAHKLGLTLERALAKCACQPQFAAGVLQAAFREHQLHASSGMRVASPLVSVSVHTLLDTKLSTIGGLPAVDGFRFEYFRDVDGDDSQLRALGAPMLKIGN